MNTKMLKLFYLNTFTKLNCFPIFPRCHKLKFRTFEHLDFWTGSLWFLMWHRRFQYLWWHTSDTKVSRTSPQLKSNPCQTLDTRVLALKQCGRIRELLKEKSRQDSGENNRPSSNSLTIPLTCTGFRGNVAVPSAKSHFKEPKRFFFFPLWF